jgi:hypothetical protein
MFTIRNLGGVGLFLAASTWLWLTPAFASRGVSTSGLVWASTRVLSLLTIALFCLATWGLFARHGWWETVALGSAALGWSRWSRSGSRLGQAARPRAPSRGTRSCTSSWWPV